ncbi:MAG: hypothetical protein RIS92_3172 [Verrucomicrobiota bacterium]
MVACGIVDGADDGELVGHLCEAREEFANFHPGNIGFDGTEFASHFGGGVRLHVEGVDVRGAAGEVDIDDGFVRATGCGFGFDIQQLGEAESAGGHAARFEESASGNVIARLGFFAAEDVQHKFRSSSQTTLGRADSLSSERSSRVPWPVCRV